MRKINLYNIQVRNNIRTTEILFRPITWHLIVHIQFHRVHFWLSWINEN